MGYTYHPFIMGPAGFEPAILGSASPRAILATPRAQIFACSYFLFLYVLFYYILYFKIAHSLWDTLPSTATLFSAIITAYLTIKIIKYAQIRRDNLVLSLSVKFISVIAILAVIVVVLFVFGSILDRYH